MVRRATENDEWDDDGEEDWRCEDDDTAEDDEEPTVPCPYCNRQIHEDSQRCPYCEQYISAEDSPTQRKPWWIIAGTLLCLYLVYRWIVG